MIVHRNNRTKYSAARENEINCISIPVITRTHQKMCAFYQLQLFYYVSQNNYSTPFTMSKPVYSHERETIEIFLCTSKFLICLATKVCFFWCLSYRTLNINSKKRDASHLLSKER